MMIWTLLILLILGSIVLDIVLLKTGSGQISNKKAAKETLFWVSLAFLFSAGLYYIYDQGMAANPNNLTPSQAVQKYITGYLIELSLSIDNLFVIALIFASFKIPPQHQHKTLFLGILGAIVLRALMIGLGIFMISKLVWMTYVFGGILLFTAYRLLTSNEEEALNEGRTARIKKFFNIGTTHDGGKYFTIENGKKVGTPLLGALIMIELSDVMFAIDSIPAILAITTDPFIVYSSNIFAILGLRSMYFFLVNLLEKFHYLKYSVFAILVFVSIKLLTHNLFEISELFSLAFISVSILMGIAVSTQKMKSA